MHEREAIEYASWFYQPIIDTLQDKIREMKAEIDYLRIDLQATRITSKMQNAVIESADEEIEHLRSLTRWHVGVPSEDGRYLVEVKDIWADNTVHISIVEGDYYADSEGWAVYIPFLSCVKHRYYVRWAYLPKDVLVDESGV